MKKQFTLMAGLCLAAATYAQNPQGGEPFGRFERMITKREVANRQPTAENPQVAQHRLTPSEQAIRLLEQQPEAKEQRREDRFIDWLDQGRLAARAKRAKAQRQSMDSVVRTSLDGRPMSKQVFQYTADGKPLHCINYVPDAASGKWSEVGSYNYEYDELGRTIARDVIDNGGYVEGGSQRYEYIYTDDSNGYTSLVYYTMTDGEWIPAQMAEYVYDDQGWTVEEIYSSFDTAQDDWTLAQRITTSYDDQRRMTSYFEYVWDSAAADWIGSTANYEGQTFTYTATGKDELVTNYLWENNAWLEFQRQQFTYDAATDNVLTMEYTFWNREKQNWEGGDKYGPYGYVENNTRLTYTYDEQGRETLSENAIRQDDGEYHINWRQTHEYDTAENGDDVVVEVTHMAWVSADPTPYARVEQHFNSFGAETYYLAAHFNEDATSLMYYDEQVRHIDEQNNYHGAEFYNFNQNEENRRYASVKEAYTYADDWQPADGYVPVSGHHWKGVGRNSDDVWADDTHDDFRWEQGNGDVLAETTNYSYVNGQPKPTQGYLNTYDYDTPVGSLVRWHIANKNDYYYNNKVLTETTYRNFNYYTGDEEWDMNNSFTDTFFYADMAPAPVVDNWNTDNTPIQVSPEYWNGMGIIRPARTADGDIYVAWTYGDDNWNQAPRLQLLDSGANKQYDEAGLPILSGTAPRQANELGLATDGEGNAIVAFGDARDDAYNYNNMPYVYKFSQDGEPLWNADGVAVPFGGDAVEKQSVVKAADGYYVTFTTFDYVSRASFVNKLLDDGSFAWAESLTLPGVDGSIVATADGFMAVYSDNGQPMAQRFDTDGQPLWEQPVALGDYTVTMPYTGSLYRAYADGADGMAIVYNATDADGNGRTLAQHVAADGAVAVGVVNPDGESMESLCIDVDSTTKTIALAWNGGDWNGGRLMTQVIGFDGARHWSDNKQLDAANMIIPKGLKVIGDGDLLITYFRSEGWDMGTFSAARHNAEGEQVWRQDFVEGYEGACEVVYDDKAAYMFWSQLTPEYSTYLAALRFFFDGGYEAPIPTAIPNVPAIGDGSSHYFDLQGRQHSGMTRGLNIVRMPDGTTRKVMMK